MSLTLEQFAPEGLPDALRNNAARTLAFARDLSATVPGLRFTSGYRSAAHNRAVGGVANSKHVQALAVDFVSVNGSYPQSLVDRVRQVAGEHGFSVLLHDAGSGLHLHCEYEYSNEQSVTASTSDSFSFNWWPLALAGLSVLTIVVLFDD